MPTGLGDEIVWVSPTLSLTNSADDLSGNGNNGTVVDASVVTDSSNGGTHAYDFQGETHRIEIGRPAEVVASNSDFTISGWVYPTTTGNARTIWGGYKSLSYNQLWSLLRIDSGNLKYWYADTNGSYRSATGPSISLNSWSHITVTIDSSRVIKFFVNGTQQGANQTLLGLSSAPASVVEWWIGQSQAGLANTPVENFDGKIDDFRWIDRVIGQSEITHLASSRGIEGSPYDFNGLGDEKLWLCPSLDDSADDISGNGNHGTYNGGMGTVADTSNGGTRAYSFDGSDDYIQRNGDVCTSQTRSYSCWVKLDNVQSYQAFISSVEVTGSGTSQHKIAIGLTNSGNFSGNFQDGGGTATATSTTTASSGAWYHVAATFDTSSGHDCEVFVNGTSVATGSGSGNLPSINRIIIGATQRKSGQVINQFDGLIDDVRIFDRVLTTTEITALASKRGYEVPQGTGPFPHPLTISIKHPLG